VTDRAEAVAIAELERAELAARERRLAAEWEAERIAEAAAAEAAAIADGVEARVTAALADRRRWHLERADAAVVAIEEELARLVDAHDLAGPAGAAPGPLATTAKPARSAPVPSNQVQPGDVAAFDAAVEAIVAAVLAEPEGE